MGNSVDPNWIMAICAVCVLVGGFVVWLAVLFGDIRFIKREVIKLGKIKHKIINTLSAHQLRISLIERHLNLKEPKISEDGEDDDD